MSVMNAKPGQPKITQAAPASNGKPATAATPAVPRAELSDAEFDTIVDEIIVDNRELLDRLGR